VTRRRAALVLIAFYLAVVGLCVLVVVAVRAMPR
jgi:hypothetical protein